ncbi:MAG: isopenicillin N synthase family oxygenase [Limimaricola sp.]|uniref:isopenicillin N synthase family dioxygenase n=1 Tax=Limimaricola sp. TaxID=2211665 RepID=UPI001D3DAAB6|nr:2OG-Fe(II) oxygenase family protein [Limimaricola sp.]MBI1417310.1 isopenicillin N synthase family oxygenase [Limimaricola sp.]
MPDHLIPYIDIAALFSGPSSARDTADRLIGEAATSIGFMTVTGLPGDTLSPDLRRRLLSIFGLPEDAKRKLYRWNFDPTRANVYRGWFPLTPGNATWKEGIDMGPDVAYGPSRTRPDDPLVEPTPLPDPADLPGWHQAVQDYYRAMEGVGQALMRALARSLGLPEQVFDASFEQGISTLRLLRYPPRTPESLAGAGDEARVTHDGRELFMLARAHVDSGFVTLLAQDGVAGLQAQASDEVWVDVPPRESTLAVNFGKLLERWTGGRVKATRHRVIGGSAERFSIPFFYEPAVDAVIAPLPLGGAADFAPVSYGDHLWDATTKFVEQAGIAHLRTPRGVTRAS